MSPTYNSYIVYVDWTVGFGLIELDGGNPPNIKYHFNLRDLKITECNIGDKVSFYISDRKVHIDFDGFDYIAATDIKLLNEDELPLGLAYIPSNVVIEGVEDNRRYRLHYFTAEAKYNRVKQLLTYGNDINELDSKGRTPLHVASIHRDVILQQKNGHIE
ncbi:MAG: ankyrin repeat domain-containing protein [Candidatus Marinimicrobia bacterium]|nr:ankyrin repeat domain-containing protein [Candidatus Neomarinimicrobiota bacterium]